MKTVKLTTPPCNIKRLSDTEADEFVRAGKALYCAKHIWKTKCRPQEKVKLIVETANGQTAVTADDKTLTAIPVKTIKKGKKVRKEQAANGQS
jgi:hypothetical protein